MGRINFFQARLSLHPASSRPEPVLSFCVFICQEHLCMFSMVNTPYTKLSSPLIRTLYDPYKAPLQGVLTVAHVQSRQLNMNLGSQRTALHMRGQCLEPRASQSPIFKDPGPKNYLEYGIWNHSPSILGTWTLWGREKPATATSNARASALNSVAGILLLWSLCVAGGQTSHLLSGFIQGILVWF